MKDAIIFSSRSWQHPRSVWSMLAATQSSRSLLDSFVFLNTSIEKPEPNTVAYLWNPSWISLTPRFIRSLIEYFSARQYKPSNFWRWLLNLSRRSVSNLWTSAALGITLTAIWVGAGATCPPESVSTEPLLVIQSYHCKASQRTSWRWPGPPRSRIWNPSSQPPSRSSCWSMLYISEELLYGSWIPDAVILSVRNWKFGEDFILHSPPHQHR